MENCQIVKLNNPIKIIGNNSYIIKKKEEELPGSFYNIEIPIINIQDSFTVKPGEIYVLLRNYSKNYDYKITRNDVEINTYLKDIIIYSLSFGFIIYNKSKDLNFIIYESDYDNFFMFMNYKPFYEGQYITDELIDMNFPIYFEYNEKYKFELRKNNELITNIPDSIYCVAYKGNKYYKINFNDILPNFYKYTFIIYDINNPKEYTINFKNIYLNLNEDEYILTYPNEYIIETNINYNIMFSSNNDENYILYNNIKRSIKNFYIDFGSYVKILKEGEYIKIKKI